MGDALENYALGDAGAEPGCDLLNSIARWEAQGHNMRHTSMAWTPPCVRRKRGRGREDDGSHVRASQRGVADKVTQHCIASLLSRLGALFETRQCLLCEPMPAWTFTSEFRQRTRRGDECLPSSLQFTLQHAACGCCRTLPLSEDGAPVAVDARHNCQIAPPRYEIGDVAQQVANCCIKVRPDAW